MYRTIIHVFCFLLFFVPTDAQEDNLSELIGERTAIQNSLSRLDQRIEDVKLDNIQYDLKKFGTPALKSGEQMIIHAAMALTYSEPHEQAKWVAHVILPDIIKGTGFRSNDFRVDPEVNTGTAVEKDYFLKYPKENGEFDYDGFGYDRGHLAPSADFRWCKKALSESYYYSNMSPQLASFNREIWADLENLIRGYIYRNPDVTLYVTTGGILSDKLPVIERSINKVAIPKQFFKVVIDRKNKKGIGFLLPHNASTEPLEIFAFTIDQIEEITGLNFYEGLPDDEEAQIESDLDKSAWLPELQEGNVESLTLDNVPRKKAYPATFGKQFMNKNIKVNVCGTVVGGRYSRKGNLLLNIDKKFPDQIFTVFVKKENLVNFSYEPLDLIGEQICTKGTVQSIGGTPTMFLEDENKLEVIK